MQGNILIYVLPTYTYYHLETFLPLLPKKQNQSYMCKGQHSIFWTASHFGCLDYIIDMSKAQRSHIKITYYFIATLDIYDIYIEVKYF